MERKELQPVSRETLQKLGLSAVFNIAAGVFLTIMTVLGSLKFVGIALSVVAFVIGVSAIFSKDRDDKKPGLFITAAGVLGLIVHFGLPIMKPIAATILGVSGIALIATGIWKGIRFLFGLKKLKTDGM